MLLEIAKVGDATHLLTGDADLLALDPFENVRIVTPSAFLQLIKGWEGPTGRGSQ